MASGGHVRNFLDSTFKDRERQMETERSIRHLARLYIDDLHLVHDVGDDTITVEGHVTGSHEQIITRLEEIIEQIRGIQR